MKKIMTTIRMLGSQEGISHGKDHEPRPVEAEQLLQFCVHICTHSTNNSTFLKKGKADLYGIID